LTTSLVLILNRGPIRSIEGKALAQSAGLLNRSQHMSQC
jgi:hypothetical protein